MIVALVAAAHAALPDPLPCNAEGIPLLVDDRVQLDDARRAHEGLALPVSSWRASVRTMVEISSWPIDSVLLLGRDRPGVAWQAARPDVRPWLTLLAALPAAQLDGLLKGDSVRVDLASTPEAFRSFLADALPALEAHTEIVLDVLTQLAPFPSKFLRGRIVEGGETIDEGTFGFSEHRAQARDFRRWLDAAPLYADWQSTRSSNVALHYEPGVDAVEADHVAEAVDAACASIARWAGEQSPDCRLDVYLYAPDAMPRYGLPAATDYALADARQIHQRLGSTRGHEVAHLVLPHAWGPSGNQAVEEGLGVYLNEDFDPLARARQRAICASAWPPLTSFDGSDRDYLGAAVLVAWFDATAGREAVRQLYASRDPDATAASLSGLDAQARQSAVCRWLDDATMPPTLL